ncbi:hypothetical protein ENSA7_40880 [Enhygromyxa salina]|uniref:Uncharacterized protein n=1 Tax=Enhygromyxa salina TaxID=215803 RepID=A0A2S9YMC7_9BACT|nr:hypothetical protein ENSA7_40880 [Enhygromyxa salina]
MTGVPGMTGMTSMTSMTSVSLNVGIGRNPRALGARRRLGTRGVTRMSW